MKKNIKNWETDIEDPVKGRETKKREKGLTMVLDKGLGLKYVKDLLNMSGEYIDYWKLSFGTSFICPLEVVKEKLEIIKSFNIDVYPGGTLFEVAYSQNRVNEYLFTAKQIGFTAVEISNGIISYDQNKRKKMINKANELGFKVLTEISKKEKEKTLSLKEMITQINKDIKNGAHKIIIEGRESGKNISIYEKDGSADINICKGIKKVFKDSNNMIIWEAPLKKQQVFFVNFIGNNVNLGNIRPEEVIALESLRRGLRGDTFKNTLGNILNEKFISNTK